MKHGDHQAERSNDLAAQLHGGAFAVTIAALLAFGSVFVLRGGLEGTPIQVGAMLVLAIVPFWLSACAVSTFGGDPFSRAIALLIGLSSGVALPALGLLIGPAVVWVAGAIVLACLWRGASALRAAWSGIGGLLLMAVISGLLTVILGDTMRLFMPEGMLLGVASSDDYWHGAIMQMIARHWSVSIGADGLVHQNYHYLFHLLVAGTGWAANGAIPLAYAYWSALTLKLLLVWSLFSAGCLLFPAGGRGAVAWRLVYAWLAAILAYGFETESYVLGIVMMAAYMPLLVLALRGGDYISRKTILGLILLCVGSLLVALAKASVGYYCAIGLFLLLWNYRGRPAIAAGLAATLALLALFASFMLIPRELVLTDSGLAILVGSYFMYFGRGVMLHYFLPAALVLAYLWRPRARLAQGGLGAFTLNLEGAPVTIQRPLPRWIAQGRGLAQPLRAFALADVNAQFIFLLLLGALFVLFTMPIGDNVWDFSAVVYSLSLLMLPMALAEILNVTLTDRPVKWILSALLAVFVFRAAMLFMFMPTIGLPATVSALYQAVSGAAPGESVGARKGILMSLKTSHRPFTQLHEMVLASPAGRLKQSLDTQSAQTDGKLVVNIAPNADQVWHYFEAGAPGKWCMFAQLLVPATTGVVEVRSAPPQSVQSQCGPTGFVWYGFGKYQDEHRTAAFTSAQLCELAKPLDARKVYRLVSYADLSKNSVVTCAP